VEHIAIVRLAVVGALVSLSNVAGADQLQFRIQINSGMTYASFANVRLLNAQNVEQFRGDADRYGRIEANVAPGDYRALVVVRGQTKSKSVRLTGTSNLQVVTLN
jgi:hypothetical protein